MMKLTPAIWRLFHGSTIKSSIPFTSYKYFSNTTAGNTKLISSHLNLLSQYDFHKPTMEELVNNNQEWNHISLTELKNTIEVLRSYKFSINDITDILKNLPQTCSIEKNKLISNLEAWLTCHFNLDQLIDVLASQPMLFNVNAECINERIPTYLLIFNNNRAKLLVFLKLSPELMFNDFQDIVEKYNYIRHSMQIRPKELLHSKALSQDLDYIKTRHIFLERSGQYEYKTKQMSDLQKLKNPTLNSIIDTSDKMFSEKIANMGLLEYETFCEYFAQELAENQEASDEESDDD